MFSLWNKFYIFFQYKHSLLQPNKKRRDGISTNLHLHSSYNKISETDRKVLPAANLTHQVKIHIYINKLLKMNSDY